MAEGWIYPKIYDVIVVGAGHAGIEAAAATAKMGCETLVLTTNLDNVGHMACNPSIGGAGKGHIAREIDALGGVMGKTIDATNIHVRFLNESKGPAVRALRAQADKKAYQAAMKHLLENQEHLDLKEATVEEFLLQGNRITGVKVRTGVIYRSKTVVITTGTFLRGLIHIGEMKYPAGRRGEAPADALGAFLERNGFEMGRFKTGTPPRLNKRTIDFSKMQSLEQPSEIHHFSYDPPAHTLPKIPCFVTHTTLKTKSIIEANLHRSAMYGGHIIGTGARYCPSIEDKVVKFSHKEQHHIFLEPEGLNTEEYYVAGASNSLPEEVQWEMIHSIPGLENAEILRPGYAIEYDVVYPQQLKPTLETKKIEGLFLAGQINGTSGYEEAGGQGIVAGINAALKVLGKSPFTLSRHEAYIGVMVDDLVTKGTLEPYRIFTARAEHRLLLRWDNADQRLTPKGYSLGLIPKEQYQRFRQKYQRIFEEVQRLEKLWIPLSEILPGLNGERIQAIQLLKRPDYSYASLRGYSNPSLTPEEIHFIETEIKYQGYLVKEQKMVEKLGKMEEKILPEDLDYWKIPSLTHEAREKLSRVRPRSIGQASRIPGVRSSDITTLMIYLYKQAKKMEV